MRVSFIFLSRDLQNLNDSGAIKGFDARENGVYITYVPTSGADPVTKKLGDITSAQVASSDNFSQNFEMTGKWTIKVTVPENCTDALLILSARTLSDVTQPIGTGIASLTKIYEYKSPVFYTGLRTRIYKVKSVPNGEISVSVSSNKEDEYTAMDLILMVI